MCGWLQVQEDIEAATFCSFCKGGNLLTLDDINATLLSLSDPSLEPLQIDVLDYLLGVMASVLCYFNYLFFLEMRN